MTDQDLKPSTLGQLLDQAVASHPDNDAIIYVDRDFRLTYREFGDLVDRLAKGLMALGVAKNEKVAVWATNVPYWVALQFARLQQGKISSIEGRTLRVLRLIPGRETRFQWSDFSARFWPRSVRAPRLMLAEQRNYPARWPLLSS